MADATVLQVNLAVPELSTAKNVGMTGIHKQPVQHPVAVRAPGPKGISGLIGDQIFSAEHHGGDEQAVYAYAREDYDWWEKELGRTLPGGLFGDNLTTTGLDVSGALLGETWQIGDELMLQVTFARIPCSTFQAKMGEPRWVKRFGAERRPGAYLRVVRPGEVRPGDRIEVVDRPAHDVTIADGFHAWLHAPAQLSGYLPLEGVSEPLKANIRRRLKL